jgi:Zinc binding domain
MNCCATDASIAESGSEVGQAVPGAREGSESVTQRCANCGGQSRPVSRKTVLLMLKPHLLEQAMAGTYNFCSARDCPVVYFDEQGSHRFTTDDLRVPAGVKASADPIPLCYCFGFDESHIRAEISRTGNTTIPERISNLIREGLCACEARNPSGVCCLGEVNKAVRRIAARK